jgi:hypothetical protein
VQAGVSAFSEQFGRARTQLVAFLAAFEFAGKLREIVELADAWNLMNARLKLATAGTREFTTAKQELFAIAQRIGVPISEVTTLYGKLQQAVRMLGGEQKTAFDITEAISQALRISGASANEAQSALLQFGQALLFSALMGGMGSALLYWRVNPLTMWLTFATFVGYAVVYTVILKPLTPQNIVIGGASGAMPPVLGWAALRGWAGSPDAVFDYFPLDPTAFLGAGPVPRGRLPQVGLADVARHPWQQLHPLADFALHRGALRGDLAALPLSHERPAVPGRSRAAWRGLYRLRLVPVAHLLRCLSAPDLSLLVVASLALVCRPFVRPLPDAP